MATEASGAPTHGAVSPADALTPEQQLLAALPAMAFTSLPDGAWDYVNPAFCAYTGLPPGAHTVLGWTDLLHVDDRGPSLRRWQSALRSAAAFDIEHRLRGADGLHRWFRFQGAPQRNAAGAITRWVGVAVPGEQAHQVDAERALRQRAELARDQREHIIALVAHELRAPLTVLIGQATLLQRRLEVRESAEPRDRQAAEVLVAQALRMKELMSALMDTAQIDHAQLLVSATRLDLGALVARVVRAHQLAHPGHSLELQAGTSPIWVAGDALRLEQVLQNLLQNAVKYSPAGSAIVVSLAPSGDQARLNVSDQGIGIAASDQAAIFQPFFRAGAGPGPRVNGLGLGLYICKAIAELHGGSIAVTSARGEGCTMQLLLPRLQPADAHAAPDTPRAVSSEA